MPQTTNHSDPAPKPNPLHVIIEGVYGRIFRVVAWSGMPPKFIVTLEVVGRQSGGTPIGGVNPIPSYRVTARR